MNESIDAARSRLRQSDALAQLLRPLEPTDFLTVYSSETAPGFNRGRMPALISVDKREEVLSKPDWNLLHGRGKPGVQITRADGRETATYSRTGHERAEPFVIERDFDGIFESSLELCEEFRLLHNLHHNPSTGELQRVEPDGSTTIVATITSTEVRVRVLELRSFLAAKEMYLCVQFDFKEFSHRDLATLSLPSSEGPVTSSDHVYRFQVGQSDGLLGSDKTFSYLLGKRLIAPVARKDSGIWGFSAQTERDREDYIIGLNPDGTPKRSDGATTYLTSVYFRNKVLDKYYQDPKRYSVEDSIVRCGTLWSLTIDNHGDSFVRAWLGDLNRDLPHSEQLYWKSFNVAPGSEGLSETFFERQIEGKFADTKKVDLVLRKRLRGFHETCDRMLGWQVLLRLRENDVHHENGLRVPSARNQRQLDVLILSLATILVDSINVKELQAVAERRELELDQKSISLLDHVLQSGGSDGYKAHIAFLRSLQALRSSGAAHRKGTEYAKLSKKLDVDPNDLPEFGREMMVRAIDLLYFLTIEVESGRFS